MRRTLRNQGDNPSLARCESLVLTVLTGLALAGSTTLLHGRYGPPDVPEASGTNRLNGFIRNVCGHVSWYHLHCAPKMHAGGNADPRKDANANAIMARAEWDANAWGALPETAPPLASSYGWRNRYVRIPSAICGSLDCIAG